MPKWQQRCAGLLAAAVVLIVVSRLAGWWPCDVACQGGGHYRRFAGLDLLWFALAVYGLLTILGWWRPAQFVTRAYAGVCAGASLFFLGISVALELVCPFCITVHVLVCAIAVLLAAWDWRWLLLGLLATNALFHHGPVRDVASPVAMVATPTDALSVQMDANRRRGPREAPLRLDVVLDLQCPHCADVWSSLAAVIGPAVREGRVHLVMRVVVRPSEPASRDLARWAFAAAADSPAAHGRYVVSFMGTRSGLSSEELRVAQAEELAPLLSIVQAHAAAIDLLVDTDQADIARLGLRGATPLVVLREANGPERGRWSGTAATAEVLAAALRPPVSVGQ